MKFIIKIMGWIPEKKLVKYLPEILGFILIKGLKWLALNKPEKLRLFMKYAKKVVTVCDMSIQAGKNGIVDTKEIKAIADAWEKEN